MLTLSGGKIWSGSFIQSLDDALHVLMHIKETKKAKVSQSRQQSSSSCRVAEVALLLLQSAIMVVISALTATANGPQTWHILL